MEVRFYKFLKHNYFIQILHFANLTVVTDCTKIFESFLH